MIGRFEGPSGLRRYLDWREVILGRERYFRSARAAGMLEELAHHSAVDFERFMGRHFERVGNRFFQLPGDPQLVQEREGNVTSTHLHNLSWFDFEGEIVRVIAVETGERCLVMEAYDLRLILDQGPLDRVTLNLWREASQAESPATSENLSLVVGTLLDELERKSIVAVFHENEVDLGKFF